MKRKPRILILDIETAPSLAWVWRYWQENIGTDQVVEEGYIMSFAAQWLGQKRVKCMSKDRHSYERILQVLWEMLDKADIVVHYNGRRFDIPFINRELLIHGYGPYSPILHIDLLAGTRRAFRFSSNKLAFVSRQLRKKFRFAHEKDASHGFSLWKRCLLNERGAWRELRAYNIQDILTTSDYYRFVKDWLPQTSGFKRVMEYVNGERFFYDHMDQSGLPGKKRKGQKPRGTVQNKGRGTKASSSSRKV